MPHKLYLRIWLAVVLAVAVLTLLVAQVWRWTVEPPPRDVIVRDPSGQVIGMGQPRWMDDGPPPHRGRNPHASPRWKQLAPPGSGASSPVAMGDNTGEFLIRMRDGQTMRMHLARPAPPPWGRPPFGFAWMLVWVGLAVALATYPIVRTLTRRLERLQDGVQRWGEGDLSVRIDEEGKDEVAFLARRFNQAAQRIQTLITSHEALLASQKSLLANASHELRSPLARIRMGMELLGNAIAPPLRKELERNVAELDQLVEEILLASRLDAHEANLGTMESVDLLGLAAEECARLDIDLDIDAPQPAAPWTVHGVNKLLRRALRNLLENARRHGAHDVRAHLGQQGNGIVLRVCDRGPGVPEGMQERIFEPFYRLPGASERDGGVGLGLSLVRSIATRHGGTVHCHNRDGGGACFVLELPREGKDNVQDAK
ncbi:sensor histidine kinase [Candidatus Symbiobacter mobilis]|uniref:histidine kinase n=1 Tax=Candidatus Symbiobacter mobilis CR TaxID=946483 RepID=U5N8C2_9BURK|nr:ATP-binding protein [Candidatus Symbiobacter mobilis]AGX87560.1 signal transduction histidine kinase [Candidatus Symbiobacter mobilis CR]